MSLDPLPPTTDEYWEDADTNQIDLTKVTPITCSTHEVEIDVEKREVHCVKCGLGTKFKLEEVDINSRGEIVDKKTKKPLLS